MIILVIIGTNENRDSDYFCYLVNEKSRLVGQMGKNPAGYESLPEPL